MPRVTSTRMPERVSGHLARAHRHSDQAPPITAWFAAGAAATDPSGPVGGAQCKVFILGVCQWTTLLSALGKRDEKDDDFDPLETLSAKSDSNATVDPAVQFQQAQVVGIIEQALARLPARQREAFLLRYWEEFDVAETAAAMGCSEGSVKTHCSRAVHALAEMLKAKGVTL